MKLLWFMEKQFDVALDRSTKIETITILQRNHAVRLITGYRHQRMQFPVLNSQIVYLPSFHVPYVNRLVSYRRQLASYEEQIESYEPDVVLFNTNNVWLLKKAARLQNRHGYRPILDIRTLPVSSGFLHNGIDHFLFRKCLRVAARHFAGVAYITEAMRDYCTQRYGLPEHRSTTWSSGVNTGFFCPRTCDTRDGTFRLLYHGTVARNRGVNQAVKAIGLLGDMDVHLTVLGTGDGVTSLKHLVDGEGLDQRVTLVPPVHYDDVPVHIARVDVGILPFPKYDGWDVSSPLKLFEYLSCGKPVVVTDIPAHTSVLSGRPFAFWARGNSPEELAAAIRSALGSRDRLATLGAEGRDFVCERYTWEKQVQLLDEFITSLL